MYIIKIIALFEIITILTTGMIHILVFLLCKEFPLILYPIMIIVVIVLTLLAFLMGELAEYLEI